MPDNSYTTLKRALHEEQERLAQRAYPGDLAELVLNERRASPWWSHPAMALALLAIALPVVALLLSPSGPEPAPLAVHTLVEDPEPAAPAALPDQATAEEITPDAVLAQADTTDKPLPEIDRDLLPLQRNNAQVWLTLPKRHTSQLAKHSQLIERTETRSTPRPPRRPFTKRSIDRLFQPRPTPSPERTQPC